MDCGAGLWGMTAGVEKTNGHEPAGQAVTGRVLTAGAKGTRDIIFLIIEVCLHDLGWVLISRVHFSATLLYL